MKAEILGKRILLIEDDNSLREVLTEELQERGLTVKAFSNVPHHAVLKEVDWALLDLRVGSDNSLEFLKLIRQQYAHIPVVMMSGFGSVASAVKAIQLGAKNFISKPVTAERILRSFTEDEAAIVETPDQEISLARMEREYIDYILQASEGNITQAAKKLGLHRQSLQRKLRKNIPMK